MKRFALCLLFITSLAFADDQALLKPSGGTLDNGSQIGRWSLTHEGTRLYHLSQPRDEQFDGGVQKPFPDFKADEVCVIDTHRTEKVKGREQLAIGAVVKDVPARDKLVIEVKATITTFGQKSAKEMSEERKGLRKIASDNERTAAIVGDVRAGGNGTTLLQSAALARQAAGTISDWKHDVTEETKIYVIRGFDVSKFKIGDDVSVSGLFKATIQDGQETFEPVFAPVPAPKPRTAPKLIPTPKS